MKNHVTPPVFSRNVNSGNKQAIHVLCVDDEAGFLKSTKQILELENLFQVEIASSVNDALQKMKSQT